MKEQKPLRPRPEEESMPQMPRTDSNRTRDPVGRGPQSGTIQQLPVRPAQNMQNEMRTKRARGRLSRETLDKLGKVLDGLYADVRKQGVPDKFKDLLRQFEERKDKGSI
jgi:hypothetical protein